MNEYLSQVQIGERVAAFRHLKGLSQEELARQIGMSRPSLAQIELGNRKMSVTELQQLAYVLEFSVDTFLSNTSQSIELGNTSSKEEQAEESYRVSTPTLNASKFINVLLYILERCAGKPNVGETLVYKLLYFSDFNYYELYEEHLTGAKYHKLPFGPVPQNIKVLLNKMIQEKMLKRIKVPYHDYQQTRYLPLKKAKLQQLNAREKEVLDLVINQFSDWSATAISEYSHKDMPWLITKEGEEIDYELALYREAPYSVRNYEE